MSQHEKRTDVPVPQYLALWRKARLAALCADDGWLNLTDRVEFGVGPQVVGSSDAADIRLSVGPERLGVLSMDEHGTAKIDLSGGGGTVTFSPVPDAMPRAVVGSLLLEIHTVEGTPALRVRDCASSARVAFPGLRYFPTDPAWCIRAGWEKLDAPVAREIEMVEALRQLDEGGVAAGAHIGEDRADG